MRLGTRTTPRTAVRLAVAGALVLLAAAPGSAAGPVAQATATALTVTAEGRTAGSEPFAVSHDGDQQTTTGTRRPVVRLAGGQEVIQGGVLVQDARTRVEDGAGRSWACAGLAGDGSAVLAAGDGSCLRPGGTASISAGTLDLSGLRIARGDVLQGLDQELQAGLQPLLDAVLPASEDALATALASLGDLRVGLDLGALESHCSAAPGTADGDARLLGARLTVEVAGETVDLVRLPAHPPAGTKVATDLDTVVASVLDALRTQLDEGLDGALAPAGPLLDQLESAVNDNVVATVAEQLGPLEDNLIDATLNVQRRPSADSIEVTALDVAVLPAARQFGFDPVTIEVGRSTCGPSGRVTAPPRPAPNLTGSPRVPTSVPAGLADAPSDDDGVPVAALALLGVLAVAAGAAAYRRAVR